MENDWGCTASQTGTPLSLRSSGSHHVQPLWGFQLPWPMPMSWWYMARTRPASIPLLFSTYLELAIAENNCWVCMWRENRVLPPSLL